MTAVNWIPTILGLAAIGSTLIVYLLTRRASRVDVVRNEQREALRRLRLRVQEAVGTWPEAAVADGGASYSAWVSTWASQMAEISADLPAPIALRVQSATYLLERTAALGEPVRWANPVSTAIADIQSGVHALLNGRPLPAATFPETDKVRELIARGQHLATGSTELEEWVQRQVLVTQQRRDRRNLLLGLQLGLSLATMIACALFLILRAT